MQDPTCRPGITPRNTQKPKNNQSLVVAPSQPKMCSSSFNTKQKFAPRFKDLQSQAAHCVIRERGRERVFQISFTIVHTIKS